MAVVVVVGGGNGNGVAAAVLVAATMAVAVGGEGATTGLSTKATTVTTATAAASVAPRRWARQFVGSGFLVAPQLGTAQHSPAPLTDPPGSRALHALSRRAQAAQIGARGCGAPPSAPANA